MTLPRDLIVLLRQPSPCFLSTVMPDGSPQLTQTWVDTDGEHVMINTATSAPPYPWYGGRDQIRVILTIQADRIRKMG